MSPRTWKEKDLMRRAGPRSRESVVRIPPAHRPCPDTPSASAASPIRTDLRMLHRSKRIRTGRKRTACALRLALTSGESECPSFQLRSPLRHRWKRELQKATSRDMDDRVTFETVIPADFPGLRALAWNRDPARAIPAAEAFALYERNWRHVDHMAFTAAERGLIARLTERFGHGAFLG